MITVQKYKTNLKCGSCVAKVKPYLDSDGSISRWSVDTEDPDKVLTIEGENVPRTEIQRHIAEAGFKLLGDVDSYTMGTAPVTQSFWRTYQPLLLVLAYLVGVVTLVELTDGAFDAVRAMGNFMGGYFLAFSFFKMLDLQGFATSFQSYDVIARPVRAYAYAYPFIELALGVAYLAGIAPVVTNTVTLIVMLVGIVGVSQALVQKRRIQCACLGTVFNLPMSKVTFIEDGLMGVMAAAMLWAN